MKKLLIWSLVIFCLSACKKDGGDSEKPVINVTSPMANQQFTAGQTVNVAATVTDNDQLHEVFLVVTNKATSVEVVHFHNHVDLSSYNLNQSFIAGAGITYEVKVNAADHTGNRSEVVFEVKGN